MPKEEAAAHCAQRPLWTLSEAGDRITRQFVARDFRAALDFLQRVGAVAEAAGHHPDLHLTDYRTVRLDVSTHAARGLTAADFALAAAIDALPADYSPKWLQEHPDVARHLPRQP